MEIKQLFGWLAQYHLDANIRPNLPYIRNGRYIKPRGNLHETGEPIETGEENPYTKGALILADGDNLVQRLKEERIILDLFAPLFTPAGNYDLFASYLSSKNKRDGAFVYDGSNETMARVSRYSNHTSDLMQRTRENFARYIPANFINEEASIMNYDDDVGTKTDLAMVLPVSHTKDGSLVHAYQIKATVHNQLGFGKVAHFGPDGLVEEFFCKSDPKGEGPFLFPEQGIVGVHRLYERGADDRLQVASQKLVGPSLEEYFKI